MKVILTEEQLNQLIREQVVEENFIKSLLGQHSMNGIAKQIVISLLAGTISFSSVPFILDRLEQSNPAIENTDQGGLLNKIKAMYEKIRSREAKITDQMKTDAADSSFTEKVEALKSYMEMAAKNQNYDPETIQISPEAMIEACNQTGFDLPLLIAQAHLESCFGLTPRARKTNSVFSVGSYDSGKNAVTYSTQNDCILPYINLMQNNYLKDRTVDDILEPGGFVNTLNKRYATDSSYERKVKSIRNKIISKYPILAS